MNEHTQREIVRQQLKRDREEQIASRLRCQPCALTRKHTSIPRPNRQDAPASRHLYGDPK
ncbi:MAG: hypothetical protein OXT74_07950 [Candidatus Poribacteria bacterium]|nr:hypothetical protein [Candidatus Poribacteria bacterium]